MSVFIFNCSAIIPGPIPCINTPDGHYIGRAEVAILGVISTLPVLIVYALAQRMVIRGTTSGAIKV
jgi:hypothetical protein